MTIQLAPRIIVDPEIRFGKPVIQGTRAPVDLIVGKLGAGMSVEEIVREYDVSPEDIEAAVRYSESDQS